MQDVGKDFLNICSTHLAQGSLQDILHLSTPSKVVCISVSSWGCSLTGFGVRPMVLPEEAAFEVWVEQSGVEHLSRQLRKGS